MYVSLIVQAFSDIRSIIHRLRNEHPNSLETINQEIRNLLVQVGTSIVCDTSGQDQQPLPRDEDIAESLDHEHTTQTRDSTTGNNVDPAESESVVDALQWLDSEIPIGSSGLDPEDSTAITPHEQEPGVSESVQSVSAQPFPEGDRPHPEPFQISEGPLSPSLSPTPSLLRICRDPEPPENIFAGFKHTVQDGVICLLPTKSQWKDFPAIIRLARELGAESIGACKIFLPEGVIGPKTRAPDSNRPSYSYHTQTRTNGTISVKMTLEDFGFQEAPATSETIADSTAVHQLEQLIKDDSNLKDVRYRTDMDARTAQERQTFGMPSSPIWPLKGDRLRETRIRVPGTHWPYAYEANNAFGAIFTIHREDWDLCSINYLYEGTKPWIVVSTDYADLLEQKIRKSDPTFKFSDCSQILRHYPTYIPTAILDKWEVPYKTICQMAGEIILTFPRVYHQGFSAGPTFAEAVNYADETWSMEGYKECDPRRCPRGLITREMMELREKDTDQLSVAGTNDASENEEQDEQEDPHNTAVQSVDGQRSNPLQKGANWKHIKKPKAAAKSPKSRKRKLIAQTQQTTPKKIAKIEIRPGQELSIILKEVLFSPKVQGHAIYQEFAEKSSGLGKDLTPGRISLLTRLFFAIASPDAFCQLRDACHSARHNVVPIPQSGGSIAETMKALDGLETTVNMASTMRRYYLVSLVSRRSQRHSEYTQRSLRQALTLSDKNNGSSGRADSRALASMMAEAYPHLKPIRTGRSAARDEYEKKLRSLKDRLVAGQRWLMMEKKFSSGILALVPTQGDYELSNTQ